MRPATRQAPRFSFCAKTLEQSRVFFLFLGVGACAMPPPAPSAQVVPLDRARLERDFPVLAGRIVPAEDLASAPSGEPPSARWERDPERHIDPPCHLRISWAGREAQEVYCVDGRIDLPGVGEVRVGGRTIAEAEQEIRQRAARYFRVVDLQIAILTPQRSPVRAMRVDVLGWVGVPRSLDRLLPGGRLSIALRAAEGLRHGALVDQVILVRGDRAILCDWLEDVFGNDPVLEDGDVIFVPGPRAPDVPYDPAWRWIAAHLEGRLDREGLVRALGGQ